MGNLSWVVKYRGKRFGPHMLAVHLSALWSKTRQIKKTPDGASLTVQAPHAVQRLSTEFGDGCGDKWVAYAKKADGSHPMHWALKAVACRSVRVHDMAMKHLQTQTATPARGCRVSSQHTD